MEVLPDIAILPKIFGVLCISLFLWWEGDIIQVEMALSMT